MYRAAGIRLKQVRLKRVGLVIRVSAEAGSAWFRGLGMPELDLDHSLSFSQSQKTAGQMQAPHLSSRPGGMGGRQAGDTHAPQEAASGEHGEAQYIRSPPRDHGAHVAWASEVKVRKSILGVRRSRIWVGHHTHTHTVKSSRKVTGMETQGTRNGTTVSRWQSLQEGPGPEDLRVTATRGLASRCPTAPTTEEQLLTKGRPQESRGDARTTAVPCGMRAGERQGLGKWHWSFRR